MTTKYNPKIMQLLRKRQEKAGIRYAKVGESPYNVLKVLFYIAAAYNIILNLLYVLGTYEDYSAKKQYLGQPTENLQTVITEIKNSMTAVLILTGLLVLSIVFLALKKHIVFGAFVFLSTVPLFIHYFQRMSRSISLNGITPYLLKHALPLFLLLALGFSLLYIAVRQRKLDKKAYDKLVEAIYAEYKDQYLTLTDEQWKEFLDTYEPQMPERVQKRIDKKAERKERKEAKNSK